MKFEIDKQKFFEISSEKYKKSIERIKDNSEGNIIITAQSEADFKTSEQISCFKSLCSYFEKAKLKELWMRDKYEDWFKIKSGMITGYKLWNGKEWLRVEEKPVDGIYLPTLKSCKYATKKEMSGLVDRVIGYTEANLQADNFGTYSDKICEILQKIEENSFKKKEVYKTNIQKEIERRFK